MTATRVLLLALLGAAPLHAQTWRVAGGAGVAASLDASTVEVAVERAWRGPLAFGGHAWAYTGGSGPVEDAPDVSGGGAGAFVAARTPGALSLRATVGAGVAVLEVGPSPFCGELFPCEPDRPRAALPFVPGGVGIDVVFFDAVGLGVGFRGGLSADPGQLSALEAGLRVRL